MTITSARRWYDPLLDPFRHIRYRRPLIRFPFRISRIGMDKFHPNSGSVTLTVFDWRWSIDAPCRRYVFAFVKHFNTSWPSKVRVDHYDGYWPIDDIIASVIPLWDICFVGGHRYTLWLTRWNWPAGVVQGREV